MPDDNDIRKVFAETFSGLFTPLTLFVVLACWLVAVLAGPFGTFKAMGWGMRALYWGVVVIGAVVVGHAVRATTVLLVGQDRPLLFDLAASVLMTVVFAPVVIVLRYWASQMVEGLYLSVVWIVVNTFILSVAVFVLRRQISPNEPGSYLVPTEEPEPLQLEPRLMRRLPDAVKGQVLRLSASDHHVKVVTVNGRENLRLRLADAIAEMEPVEGFCIHRSHWVARAAIAGVARENAHKHYIVLSNGDRVPVSRKYRPYLEAAGIIDAS